jgi:Ca-activated chloride channel family protein
LWGVLTFVGLLIYLERRQSGALAQFASVVLQPRLVNRNSVAQRVWRIIFLALFGVFSTLAMMRPQWGIDVVATPRVGAEIMICLDVSKSMLAEDAVPNRLARAKADIRDLLSYLDGDQVGLIAFAGRASVLSPLTPDFDFLRLALDDANPNAVSRGGTRLEEPIRKAIQGFGAAGDVSRSILLITDGEDHDSFPLEAAKAAAERGIRILAVGFGDEAGSKLLITDPVTKAREIVRTSDGTPVRTRLDGELLRELALLTDGAYIPAGTGALDLQSIYDTHIGPLTRGQLDGQTRTVRNDAYQWAIALAGLALLSAVLCTLRTDRAAALQVAMLCVVLFLSGPAPSARAQGQGSNKGNDPATGSRSESDPESGLESASQTQPNASSKQEQNQQPEPARTVYNQGLTALDADDLALSVERFERARTSAGTDGETRFRATYSLGWAEVRQADSLLDEEPKQALEALERSAVWFRDAVSLRPKAAPPRYNLELIERRISQLADALAKKSGEDLGALLEALIMSQRQVLGDIGAQLEKARSAPSPNITTVARQSHRALSARQLANIELANTLSVRAQREGDALKAKSEQKTPQEALREAQLGGLGHFLHIAQEKLTGTRARLRRVQTEPAYRRGADGLDALKQARDQLLDPIQRLDALLTDERELVALSRARISAAVTTVTPGAKDAASSAPAWATDQYLSEAQARLIQRLLELNAGLDHAQQQPVAAPISQGNAAALLPGATPAPAPADPKQAQDQERLRALAGEALPLLGEAARAFEQAAERLQAGDMGDAHAAQHEGYLALASARELFLDLRRLIETTYQTQTALAAAMVHLKANANANANAKAKTNSKLGQTLDLTTPAKRNLTRMQRLGRMLSDELTTQSAASASTGNSSGAQNANPQQQRIEQGYEHWRLANEQMHASLTPIELANTEVAARESAAAAVNLSLVHLQNLRRLFFSIIENLKETAQRQQSLNDETEVQRALPDSKPEQATRLSAEQKTLGETANSIAEALSQQTAQSQPQTGPAPNAPTPTPGPSQQEIEQLQRASGLVKAASQAMAKADIAMATPDLAGARAPQNEAFAKLSEAIAALTPPPQPQDSPEDGAEQSEKEQSSNGDKQQPTPAEGDEHKQAEAPSNMDQLLQQVRDKEAQRRRDRAARANGYAPVEKDW